MIIMRINLQISSKLAQLSYIPTINPSCLIISRNPYRIRAVKSNNNKHFGVFSAKYLSYYRSLLNTSLEITDVTSYGFFLLDNNKAFTKLYDGDIRPLFLKGFLIL
jgi:hypothetical protein